MPEKPRNGFYASHTFPPTRRKRRPLGDTLIDIGVATIVCSGVVVSVLLALAAILGSLWLALWLAGEVMRRLVV